ncbi:MAG: GHKL domain-containing protein [Ruminococcus sp.]|nr:GHKL domain-containing protein [Ruminococcus sp.]
MLINLLIFTLCFVPGIILRLAPFKESISKKQRIVLISIHSAVLVINWLSMYFITGAIGVGSDVMKVDIFAFGILASVINLLVLRKHTKEQLFTCGLIMLQDFMIISAVTYIARKLITFVDVSNLVIIVSTYCLAAQILLFWFFRKLIVSTVKPFLSLQAKNYWNGIWFVSVFMFLSCFFALPLGDLINSQYTLITRLFQYIVIVALCRTMGRDSLAIKERMELEKGLSLQQNHYMELANRIEDARRIRHDFKHRITAIHQYLDNEDYDGLKAYCNELQSHNNADVSIPYTGNPAVDGIMYHYASIAKQNGISFEYKKINPPDISDVDLCTLLGNALDNAVTACKNVTDNPFIQVIANGEGAGMQLLIRNSFDGVLKKDKNKFLTRKSKGDHGIGISSMQEICERNDILMKIVHTDNTFDVLFVF